MPGHRLELDADVKNDLLELQQKGIDINRELREFLERRKLEIAREKEELSALPARSRHIPIYHTRRSALARSHDSRYLAPLCREHHAIAHAVDEKMRAGRGVY